MVDSHERDAAYEAAWSRSLAVAMRQGLSRHDAEDVAVDALERLWRQPQLPDNLDAWVTTVTKNLVVDARRAAAARPPLRPGEAPAEPAGRRAVVVFLREGEPVSAQGMQELVIAQVWAELEKSLSPKEMRLLGLLAAGASHEEIAVELGYGNARSVTTTVNRIRSKITDVAADIRREMATHPQVYG